MDTLSNRITLQRMRELTIDEIAALPAALLSLLADDIAQMKKLVAGDADKLAIALDAKYGRRATETRKATGKDTGIVRIDDGEIIVIAELPKRVEWNQGELEALGERIEAAGEKARDYIDVKFSVSEARFNALPPHLQAPFHVARTVKTGKPSYALEARKE